MNIYIYTVGYFTMGCFTENSHLRPGGKPMVSINNGNLSCWFLVYGSMLCKPKSCCLAFPTSLPVYEPALSSGFRLKYEESEDVIGLQGCVRVLALCQ